MVLFIFQFREYTFKKICQELKIGGYEWCLPAEV